MLLPKFFITILFIAITYAAATGLGVVNKVATGPKSVKPAARLLPSEFQPQEERVSGFVEDHDPLIQHLVKRPEASGGGPKEISKSDGSGAPED